MLPYLRKLRIVAVVHLAIALHVVLLRVMVVLRFEARLVRPMGCRMPRYNRRIGVEAADAAAGAGTAAALGRNGWYVEGTYGAIRNNW